jgi:hypothetical protein
MAQSSGSVPASSPVPRCCSFWRFHIHTKISQSGKHLSAVPLEVQSERWPQDIQNIALVVARHDAKRYVIKLFRSIDGRYLRSVESKAR